MIAQIAPYSLITELIRYANQGIYKSYLKSPQNSPGAQAIKQITMGNYHTHHSLVALCANTNINILWSRERRMLTAASTQQPGGVVYLALPQAREAF